MDLNRALAAVDLTLKGDSERAVFQLAYMAQDDLRAAGEAFERLARACREILPQEG